MWSGKLFLNPNFDTGWNIGHPNIQHQEVFAINGARYFLLSYAENNYKQHLIAIFSYKNSFYFFCI